MNYNANKTNLRPGLNFRLFRKILNKTQEELAAEMQICKSTISNFERGYTLIKPNYLHYLYAEYGLNIQWLFTGRGRTFARPGGKPPPGVKVNERFFELVELMKIPEVENAILQTLKEAKKKVIRNK
ncbi:MAG: helix-turn-helix transcriptional regulator [Candidatus Aminicenantes bacterium]|nr:helix-turn-helix transcriptional regulator [Candidatus Aminicenantes bacterium]